MLPTYSIYLLSSRMSISLSVCLSLNSFEKAISNELKFSGRIFLELQMVLDKEKNILIRSTVRRKTTKKQTILAKIHLKVICTLLLDVNYVQAQGCRNHW